MFEHVVVAAHFAAADSPLFSSLEQLRTLGTRRLTLVDVLRSQYAEAHREEARENARNRLEEEKAALEAHGLEIDVDVRTGQPAQELAALARARGASLILVGSQGEARVREFLRGSTVLQLARKTGVPMLIEPIASSSHAVSGHGFNRVLLATDFSSRAHAAEQMAVDLAATAEQILVVHTLDEDLVDAIGQEEASAQARARLDALASRFPGSGPSPELFLVDGDPANALLDVARKQEATLIVIGKRGGGPVDELLLGATAERVLRKAACSVLLVPQRGVVTQS